MVLLHRSHRCLHSLVLRYGWLLWLGGMRCLIRRLCRLRSWLLGSRLGIVVKESHDRGFVWSLRLVKLLLLQLLLLLLWHVWHLLLSVELLSSLLLSKWVMARLRLALHMLHGRLLAEYLLAEYLLAECLLACLCYGLASICKKRVGRGFWRVQGRRTLVYYRALVHRWVLERTLGLLWDLTKTRRCYPSWRAGERVVSCRCLVCVDLREWVGRLLRLLLNCSILVHEERIVAR
jgi:hypothetical protein